MIVLIGATGAVGGEIAKQLVIGGTKAKAIVRDLKKAEGLRQLGLEVVQGDADQPGSLRPLLDGAEKLLFSTAAGEHLVETHTKIIEAAKEAQVPHVLKISALPVPNMRFSTLHAESDRLLQDSGLPFTILRPAYFMQNLLASARTVQSEGTLYLPLGEGRIAMIDVRDIAAAAVKTLTDGRHAGKTYDLTGPGAVSGHDVAAALAKAMDRPVKFVSPEPEAFFNQLLGWGLSSWMLGGVREMMESFRAGHGSQITKDVESVLGRKALSLEQFAKDHAHVFAGTAS
ncbi:MAG TPA: SDR family oxidoreductase [Bryobacteraceae bacterium]|nr:SDR family oxidoreductase [Bryobacteraceae bacterium]